ncbi:MAG: lysozyme inhibitor LprI family protein, partial [Cyanobacteria bacterium]|nr:lysozyme inhibitor LprI family protein [Cyanobacteriota bacterium]
PFGKQKSIERVTQQILKKSKNTQTAFDKINSQLKQTLTPTQLDLYDQTDRAWSKYRDLHAQTVLSIRGLDPNSPDGLNSKRLEVARLTQIRIEQLKKVLSRLSPTEPLASSRYKFSDAMLNTTYTKLRDRLPPDHREILKQTELAWIAYRDQATNLRAQVLDIPPHAPEREACMYELVKQRTTELNDLFQQISLHTKTPIKSNSN